MKSTNKEVKKPVTVADLAKQITKDANYLLQNYGGNVRIEVNPTDEYPVSVLVDITIMDDHVL